MGKTVTTTAADEPADDGIADVALYLQQQDFADSEATISGFVGGRGTGKSWIAAYKMMKRAKAGRFYMIVAPTYPVMMDTIWRTFKDLAEHLGRIEAISLAKPPSMVIRTLDGGFAKISFRSGEDPDALRGPNLSGAILEEASVQQEAVLDIVTGSLREGGELGYLDFVFTPKGKMHWTYNVFYDRSGNRRPGVHLSQARTEDNPFNDAGFAQLMRGRYTSALAAQEVDGLFVDLAGIMFQRHWFPIVDPQKVPMRAERVRYWDKAATEGGGDYSAGVLVAYAGGTFFVEHVVRGQWSPDKRNKIMREVAAADHRRHRGTVQIWIEQSGGDGGKESAILSIKNLVGYPVFTETVSGVQHRIKDKLRIPGSGKIVRAMPFAAQAENGNVCIVDGEWNQDWLDEMCAFPEAVHDDQVDATVGAFNKLAMRPLAGEGPQAVEPEISTPRSMQLDRGYGKRKSIFGG